MRSGRRGDHRIQPDAAKSRREAMNLGVARLASTPPRVRSYDFQRVGATDLIVGAFACNLRKVKRPVLSSASPDSLYGFDDPFRCDDGAREVLYVHDELIKRGYSDEVLVKKGTRLQADGAEARPYIRVGTS
jgi:hypothetical protein